MKHMKTIASIAVLIFCLELNTPVLAQTGGGSDTSTTMNDDDNDVDYGWVGLFGLLGLLGLRKKDDKRSAAYSTTNTAR